jgi:DNA modification methylase
MTNIIEFGDCREIMRRWAVEGVRVQTCVTSPPYFGLRDYGTAKWEGGDPACQHVGIEARTVSGGAGKQYSNAGSNRVFSGNCACGAKRVDEQIGLEQTPDEYVAKMVEVFRCVRDVLADDGTVWLNLGDSYAGGSASGEKRPGAGRADGIVDDRAQRNRNGLGRVDGLKPKDLIGIPWRVAFALQADGWYLRQDIIWHKPNPMPESVRDRCTKAHEYIFLLSKNERYFYDVEAVKEKSATPPHKPGNKLHENKVSGPNDRGGNSQWETSMDKVWGADGKRNRRSVWTVTTKPYKGAHFATFPPDLIEPCVLAGSQKGDTVLDPFMGSGTTAAVAIKHGRNYLGCELNSAYKELQIERIGISKPTDLFNNPI